MRIYKIEDEVKQPSINDEMARQLVESNVKIVNGRYEIPVPLKMDVVTNLPDNYVCVFNRTTNLRQNALKSVKLKDMLEDTFQEMISEGLIVRVDDAILSDTKRWYLPFFVTKQDEARVMFDRAATFKGAAINDAVHSGINLLNGLVEVLTRFRVGRYACPADLSNCFFQVAMSESQKDLFRLVWFRSNDADEGKVQLYRFTRHVWGINSSPFIALFAIKELIAENPTNAGTVTLTATENNRYMDKLLLVSDSIDEFKRISSESASLFDSRGFKLRKWVADGSSKTVLSGIPKCDLGSDIREIDLRVEPMPDSKTLGLVWDVKNDQLRVCFQHQKFGDVTARRERLNALAGQFDPLGILGPCLLDGKLILQKATFWVSGGTMNFQRIFLNTGAIG